MGEFVVKIKSKLLGLLGTTFLLSPCLSSVIVAMEQYNTHESLMDEEKNNLKLIKRIKEDLLSYFNELDDGRQQKWLNRRFQVDTQWWQKAEDLQKEVLKRTPEGSLSIEDFEALRNILSDESSFIAIIESIVPEILQPNIQNAVNFMILKFKNENLDEKQLKIKYFNTYFLKKLPEIAYDAIIPEGMKQYKINKIAVVALNRQNTFEEKISYLIMHDLIDYEWLISECDQFLADMREGANDLNQQEIDIINQHKSEDELAQMISEQNHRDSNMTEAQKKKSEARLKEIEDYYQNPAS